MKIYACNACGENFHCRTTTDDEDNGRPVCCPYIREEFLDVEPKWRQVKWLGEDLLELLEWKEEIENKCERTYPDWYYTATTLEGSRGFYGLLDEIKHALKDDYFVTTIWEQTKLKNVLDKIPKKELAQAMARVGFSAGIMYGEWRRKVYKETDWEIYDNGED